MRNRKLVTTLSLTLLVWTSSALRGAEPLADHSSAAVLDLRLPPTPQPNYDGPVPETVAGRVSTDTPDGTVGVAGVAVTDGYSVVTTDARGNYSLKPDPAAVFIYITRPTGWDVSGHWYQTLSSRADFSLARSEDSEHDYIFIHVTDTHVSQDRRSQEGLSQFVREANQLRPPPRFVINSGDLLNLSKALVNSPESGREDFRQYVGIMNHLTMPHYNVAGDHTDSSYRLKQFPRGDHRCGKALYWEFLGPNFFSFEYGNIHFTSVDYGYHLGRKQLTVRGRKLEYPTNQIQPIHASWLNQDAQHRAPGTFIVTTSEADLGEHFSGFDAMAEEHDVRMQLVGETHILSHKKRHVPYRSGGALAGCWWNPRTKGLCPDLSPQGYVIYRVTGERMEYFYKGLGQRVAILSPRIGSPIQGEFEIFAHLVQPAAGEALEYSLDGNDWKQMTEAERPFYRTIYRATASSRDLSDGRITLHVRSTAGEVATRALAIANGATADSPGNTDATLSFTVGADTGWTTHKGPDTETQVMLNGHVIGTLTAEARKSYSFPIRPEQLLAVNVLQFRFAETSDSMSLSSPVLTCGGNRIYDLKDQKVRAVRIAHWGAGYADRGGFVVGSAGPPDESPFHRKQDEFCFVISDLNKGPDGSNNLAK